MSTTGCWLMCPMCPPYLHAMGWPASDSFGSVALVLEQWLHARLDDLDRLPDRALSAPGLVQLSLDDGDDHVPLRQDRVGTERGLHRLHHRFHVGARRFLGI